MAIVSPPDDLMEWNDDVDPRTPRPNPRIALIGPVLVGLTAVGLYVLILHTDHLPAEWVSVLMYVATPVLAGVALAVIWERRSESEDPDLSWFAVGLGVGLVAIVLQLISFPTITADGGPFRTSASSRPALYLLFHLTPAVGALLGALRVHKRHQAWVLGSGITLAFALAVNLVPLPVLMEGTEFTPALIRTEVVIAAFVAASAGLWMWRAGRRAVPLVAWIGVAQVLVVLDLVFSLIGGERFSPMWWGSLSMRVATYAVLAAGALGALFTHSRRLEHYLGSELDRRELQLRTTLRTVAGLLHETTQVSNTLQEQLLPRRVITPDNMEIVARYSGAGDNKQLGGDWYDVIPLPQGGVALVIGDVEGHDLQAAAIMGQVRAAVNSYALEGHPPAILLQRVNRFLLTSEVDRFVALVYVQVFPEDRLITTAVAGNPAPILVRPGTPLPQVVNVEIGPPLGLEESYTWTERTMLVPAGTDLALYTDGVFGHAVWAGDPGEEFPCPVARLVDQPWSPDDLADALMGPPTFDDAAALVARVHGAPRATASRSLPATPISSPIARHWLADLTQVWAEQGLLPDIEWCPANLDTAALLLTELVSNALRHGDHTIRVEARLDGPVLHVEVFDTGHRMPFLHEVGVLDTSGRGLQLVQSLSTGCGVTPQETGKSVWFDLDLTRKPVELADTTVFAGHAASLHGLAD